MKKVMMSLAAVLLIYTSAFAEQTQLRVKVSPVPPNLSAQVAFVEPSGNRILDAEETGTLVLTIQNRGKGDAFDVRVEIKATGKTDGLTFERNVLIGTIPAGQTVKKEITLAASEDIPTASISLTVDIREANGFDPDPMKVSFKTRAFEPPRLVVADMRINDQNGNGRVEPMEMVEMTVRVQNAGRWRRAQRIGGCAVGAKRRFWRVMPGRISIWAALARANTAISNSCSIPINGLPAAKRSPLP